MQYDKNFETIINYIFNSEGGFSNNKNDKGGRTNFGITQATYNSWRKKQGLLSKDIKNITKDEAKQLYYEEFWIPTEASKIEDLREGYLLFDTAINSGPYEAKKLYEKSNGNIYKFLKNRKSFYDNFINKNPNQEEFRQGWYNRLKDIENNMNEIINKGYYVPPYQNEKTPFDNNFDNKNLNTDYSNYSKEQLQNIRNKYLYIKNNNQPTGFAAPIKPNHIYTREEINKMTTDEFVKHENAIMKQLREKGIPTKSQLQKHNQKSSAGNSANSNDGRWVTINGNHVLIKD